MFTCEAERVPSPAAAARVPLTATELRGEPRPPLWRRACFAPSWLTAAKGEGTSDQSMSMDRRGCHLLSIAAASRHGGSVAPVSYTETRPEFLACVMSRMPPLLKHAELQQAVSRRQQKLLR